MARAVRRMEMLPDSSDARSDAVLQASFDFLPQEMRHRRRFGSVDAAEAADRRAQLRLIDRQVTGLGSRIVAARLREILRPRETSLSQPLGQLPDALPDRDLDVLQRARAEMRERGSVLFYFRDGDELPPEKAPVAQQRLHPRPLPARYYDPRAMTTE